MKVLTVDTYEDFDNTFNRIQSHHQKLKKEKKPLYVSDLLFRGQANSEWRLQTTLERAVGRRVNMPEYHEEVIKAWEYISQKFNKFIDLDPSDIDINFYRELATAMGSRRYKWIQFYAYLRQLGFPSPLLDWSTSLEVALYFAFYPSVNADYVSVYSLIEFTGDGKTMTGKVPYLSGVGPNLNAHSRHNAQQSQYTMCVVSHINTPYYENHENFVQLLNESNSDHEEYLVKINISSKLRREITDRIRSNKILSTVLFENDEPNQVLDLAFDMLKNMNSK